MRLFSSFFGVILLAGTGWAAGAQAPTTVLVEPPTPLLAGHTGGLTLGPSETGKAALAAGFDATSCAPVAQGGNGETCAAVVKEDGLTRYASGSYTRAAGGAPLTVFALEFGDATGAYSAYTFYRTLEHGARVVGGNGRSGKAAETTSDAGGSLVWAGTAVLRVEGKTSANELAALTGMLPKVGGRLGLAPLLPTYLPAKGIENGTERYSLGPVAYKAMGGTMPPDLLAWDKSAEVITAEYAGRGNGGGSVTLMLYPTPQIAGDRGRALEKYVNGAGLAQFGTLKMRRVGPLLGMTTGDLSAEQAMALMTGLHLNGEVTFDKPMPLEFHAEIKKTATLLQSIAAFCGLGLLAALVLGIFFGGARAGIRMLQGKSAASDPEFLTINLRSDRKGLFAGKEKAGDGQAG
jgi:hypothetical protein